MPLRENSMSSISTVSKKARNAFKWASISEILAKIITPLINMVLTRILAPEVFGVVATVTMVVSFAEVFVDSGFNKVLIQRSVATEELENRYMSVAFWINLTMSVAIWIIIILFNEPIARLAGNRGQGHLLIVAGCMIPLYGIVGIQNARIRKQLEFRKLFVVRLLAALCPLVVTVPLALLGFDYWSLIIGNISSALIRMILLFWVGKYVPRLYFNYFIMKDIFSAAIWTTLDGLAVWATSWIDIFLISNLMTEYQLGLYKHSTGTINSLFGLATAAVTPVMFSALSKVNDKDEEFNGFFLNVQKALCAFILPMGVGIFFYRDLVTSILFGSKWTEAANIVGIFSLTSALRIISISVYSEAYRAKGRFKLPLILQLIDLAILLPVCVISAKSGFWSLVYARSFVKLDLVIPEFICIWMVCGISVKRTAANLSHAFIAAFLMGIAIVVLQSYSRSVLWELISIAIAGSIYVGTLLLFKEERDLFIKLFLKPQALETAAK